MVVRATVVIAVVVILVAFVLLKACVVGGTVVGSAGLVVGPAVAHCSNGTEMKNNSNVK